MIRIKNLNMTYRSANTEHHAVRGVSLEIETGQFYTLLGPSGCGKTTTLRCVAGLEEPDSGTIEVENPETGGSIFRICLPLRATAGRAAA